ncbi:MAG: glycosyltransferase family 4 protein [Dehalococcoidia bacterium]|nr:glycosyltransferase family 4 protein [Dehalococcoidia bacterium]
MKVLLLSHMYIGAYNELQGIFVHQQALELIKLGCKIRVVCPVPWTPGIFGHFPNKWKRYLDIPARALNEGVVTYYPRYLTFPRNWFYASIGARMYRGIRPAVNDIYRDFKFDIIHAHTALPDGYAGCILKKDYVKPLVVTVHGEDLQFTIHRSSIYKNLITDVFNQADRTIAVSTKLKNIAVKETGLTESKIAVINNGYRMEETDINGRTDELRHKYAGCKILLSVSNLINSKGIELNLRAVAHLAHKYPDLKYLVIGSGSELKALRRLVHILKLEGRVEFLGQLPHSEVMKYMALCDIFCLPSWMEGFGVVYLEAAAHGKPVIACAGEGITDVVIHNRNGLLVKPRRLPGLIAAISYLLDNPDKASAMGRCARETVDGLTWSRNAGQVIDLYNQVVRDHINQKTTQDLSTRS